MKFVRLYAVCICHAPLISHCNISISSAFFTYVVFYFFISLEVVKSNGKLIPQVVKVWVEQYEKDPKPAMVELLTMLFEVSVLLFSFLFLMT